MKASYKIYSRLLALAVAAAVNVSSQAQSPAEINAPVSITATSDTATMTMGDRAMVHVEVVRNERPGILLDGLRTDNQGIMQLGDVEVRQVTVDSTQIGENRYQINYHYLIQPFEVGAKTVGPFKYVIDGDTVESQLVSFKVDEPDMPKVMRDSLYINPMESTVSIPAKWYDFIPEWWPWLLIALGIIGLAVLVAILYKKNGARLLPHKKIIPPYQLAINRLSKLKQRRMAESGHDKEYYTELTDILRQYLEGRFNINAREMTSSQIIDALEQNPEISKYVDSMNAMLQTSDFVKFAKHRSNVDDNVRAFATVHDFVTETRPEEPEEAKTKRVMPRRSSQKKSRKHKR